MPRKILMKGRFMISQSVIVGNAHVFMVFYDMDTKKEYGVHFEITEPYLILNNSNASGVSIPVTLNGYCVSQEIYDLDFCKSGSIERLPNESI